MRRGLAWSLGFLILAGLILGTLLLDQGRAETQREFPLMAFEPDRVSALTLDLLEGPPARLRREGAGWRLEEPRLAEPRLLEARVDALLLSLAASVPRRVVREPGRSLPPDADFGLDWPRRLEFQLEGGGRAAVDVGGRGPSGALYLRVPDGSVLAIDPKALAALPERLADLRDTSLPFPDRGTLRELRLLSRRRELRIQSEGASAFFLAGHVMTAPWARPRPVDGEALASFLASLPPLSILRFVDEPGPPGDYGLDHPSLSLLLDDGRSRLSLLAGDPAGPGERWAKLEGGALVFTLAASALAALDSVEAFSLVSRLPLLHPLAGIAVLELESEGEAPRRFEVDAVGASPSFRDGGRLLSGDGFRRAFERLVGLEAAGLAGGAAGGAGKAAAAGASPAAPRHGLRYGLRDGGERRFEFLPAGEGFLALREDGLVEFLVREEELTAALAPFAKLE